MKRTSWILLLTFFAGASAQAALPPVKVIGRGIADRKTGETLQIACVGKKVSENSLDRSCETIQFFHFDPQSQKGYLVSDPLTNIDGSEVKERLKDYLKAVGIDRRMNPWGYVYAAVFFGAASFVIPGSAVLYVWLGIGGALTLSTVPRTFFSNTMGVHNTSELQNRAVSAWQIKPKKVSSKRFQKILAQLNYRGTIPLEEAFKSDSAMTDLSESDLASAEVIDVNDPRLEQSAQISKDDLNGLEEELNQAVDEEDAS